MMGKLQEGCIKWIEDKLEQRVNEHIHLLQQQSFPMAAYLQPDLRQSSRRRRPRRQTVNTSQHLNTSLPLPLLDPNLFHHLIGFNLFEN